MLRETKDKDEIARCCKIYTKKWQAIFCQCKRSLAGRYKSSQRALKGTIGIRSKRKRLTKSVSGTRKKNRRRNESGTSESQENYDGDEPLDDTVDDRDMSSTNEDIEVD